MSLHLARTGQFVDLLAAAAHELPLPAGAPRGLTEQVGCSGTGPEVRLTVWWALPDGRILAAELKDHPWKLRGAFQWIDALSKARRQLLDSLATRPDCLYAT